MTAELRARERSANFALRAYKLVIAPVLHAISPSRCIYLPTCSEYASLAVARFGLCRGSWLALKRLVRCHPFAEGGFDPVPELPGNLTAPNSVQQKSSR
jgi:uncharacterized protein